MSALTPVPTLSSGQCYANSTLDYLHNNTLCLTGKWYSYRILSATNNPGLKEGNMTSAETMDGLKSCELFGLLNNAGIVILTR